MRESGGAFAIGRPHVAKALVRLGAVDSVDAAFKQALSRGKPGYVPQLYTTPEHAIQQITAAGGIPVLAHPGRLKDRILIDELAGEVYEVWRFSIRCTTPQIRQSSGRPRGVTDWS